MTPAEWNALLEAGRPWHECYPVVEEHARTYLTEHVQNDLLTTTQLVEALYPEQFARGEGILARRRIFKALAARAPRTMSDCCTKGEPKRLGRTTKYVKPWLWHAPRVTPKAIVKCPHCGGVL